VLSPSHDVVAINLVATAFTAPAPLKWSLQRGNGIRYFILSDEKITGTNGDRDASVAFIALYHFTRPHPAAGFRGHRLA